MTIIHINHAGPDDPSVYIGEGETEVERAADAAFQEFLDELEPLDYELVGASVRHPDDFTRNDPDLAKSRLAMVNLLLHHGWLPPEAS
jgi:hypothetical protein